MRFSMDDYSEEARQTLLQLSTNIQELWWQRYRFKFQRGWIAASLFLESDKISDAISFGRKVQVSHRMYEDPETIKDLSDDELKNIPTISDDLFDLCWNHYLHWLTMQEEREDEDE